MRPFFYSAACGINRTMQRLQNYKGFSLVELSIVLVIIGILISASLKLIGPISLIVKMRETKEIQDATAQSIISWAASRNTLPSKDEFSSIAKSPRDSWGQLFAYKYYSSLSRTSATKDTICGRRTTGLKLYTNYTTSSIAFAIISRADNSEFKSAINGTAIADSGPAPAGLLNASGTNVDIIRWVTLDELRSKIGCQGPALRIVNTELPSLSVNNLITITADGGVPFTSGSLEWCIEDDNVTNPLDATFFAPLSISFQPNISCKSPSTPSFGTGWFTASYKLSLTAPSTPKNFSFTVYVRDRDNNSAQRPFKLNIL